MMEKQELQDNAIAEDSEDLNADTEVVAVVGAGAWGTVLSWLLAEQGYRVNLWCYEPDLVMAIRNSRENLGYLPGVLLPRNVLATSSMEIALEDANSIVFAVPSHAARSVLTQMLEFLTEPLPILSVSKGIETDTLMLMTEIMMDVLPASMHDHIAVLSGPSFAQEVRRRQPTHVVLASDHPDMAAEWQKKLMTYFFRPVLSTDVLGVQLGGAVKNIISLGTGMLDGLELGENTKAAFLTHGMDEIIRLGEAMGADPKTFTGLAGLGDLILTGTGSISRNRDIGVRLSRGRSLEKLMEERMSVAEGVNTAKAVAELAKRHSVEMPIVAAMNTIMYEDADPRSTLLSMLERLIPDHVETATANHAS
ncbi:MAG TPA: NAD(P)-dependent glycerol-3-phosphate dehydrogenase [Nitrospirales bacterium]|nr:NAD(P)-dependent glycerol-3-phosphate dehydrogenase [Nitrospirales bacterium]